MKNFKFLSSLAVAGMLTTGIMTTTLAATDVPTEPVGIFKELSGVKNIVPFVLANRDDKVCISDLTASGKFNNITMVKGSTVINQETVLGTGDTFKANGDKEYTVVVYGDVDGNGAINILDALAIQDSVANGPSTLTGAQAEAANVLRKDGSGINILDALHIEQYRAPETDIIIDEPPVEEEPAECIYTMTVNGNNIVNNINKDSSVLNVDMSSKIPEDKINAKLLVEVEGEEEPIEIDVPLTEEKRKEDVSIDLSEVLAKFQEGGEVKAKLVTTNEDGEEEVLANVTFNVCLQNPIAVNASAIRSQTYEAKMSLEATGEAPVTKVYYQKVDFGTQIGNAKIKFDKEAADRGITDEKLKNEIKTADLTDNKLVDQVILSGEGELTNGVAYDIYYVVEDENGNRSQVYGPVTITKDIALESAYKVTDVELKKFTDVTAAQTQVVWKVKDSSNTAEIDYSSKKPTFEFVLYRGETPLATATKSISNSPDFLLTTLFGSDVDKYFNEEGDYKVTILMKGDETTPDSEVASSNVEKVSKVTAPTEVAYNKENKEVTWKYDGEEKDIARFKVEAVYTDADGKEHRTELASSTATETNAKARKATVASEISDNEVYKIVVTALDNDKVATLASDPAESEKFINITTTNFVEADPTTKSINIDVTNPCRAEGAVYTVDVYKVAWDVTPEGKVTKENYGEVVDTKTVALEKDSDKLIVKDLEPGTEYAFKVTLERDGVKATTDFIHTHVSKGADYHALQCKTKMEMPVIEKLTVDGTAKVTSEGHIAVSKNANAKNKRVLSINGKDYEYLANDYDAAFAEIYDLILDNHLRDGDVITYKDGKLTVRLQSRATDSVARNLTASDITELDLQSDGFLRKIQTTAKNVTLSKAEDTSDAEAVFNIDGINTDNTKVVLENDVKVEATSAKKVVIAKGATATINNIKITSSKQDVEIEVSRSTIKVTPTDESNDLTFDSKENMNIQFVGVKPSFGSTQTGTITVKSTGGTVNVSGVGMNVASNLKVEATGGEVSVESDSLVGEKNVSVKNENKGDTTTVKVNPTATLPEGVTFSGLDIKEYTAETLLKEQTVSGVTAENAEEVIAFINSFELNGKAKLMSVEEVPNANGATGKHLVATIEVSAVGTTPVEGVK